MITFSHVGDATSVHFDSSGAARFLIPCLPSLTEPQAHPNGYRLCVTARYSIYMCKGEQMDCVLRPQTGHTTGNTHNLTSTEGTISAQLPPHAAASTTAMTKATFQAGWGE